MMAWERKNRNNKGEFGKLEYLFINVKIRIAIIICLAVVVLFILYLVFPHFRNELSFVTAVIGGAAVVYSAYYVGVTAKTAAKQLAITAETATEQINSIAVLRKKEKSLDLIRDVQTHQMVTLRRLIESEVDTKKEGVDELYHKIRTKSELLGAIGACFGCWEDTSIAIQSDVVDEKILYDSLSFILPYHFRELGFFIEKERDFYSDKTLWVEMEKLAHAWSQGLSLLTGKAFT